MQTFLVLTDAQSIIQHGIQAAKAVSCCMDMCYGQVCACAKLHAHAHRQDRPLLWVRVQIDALCTARQEGESEFSRRVRTEILAQMEGVQSSKGQLLVLGATNCPYALDPALRRRFAKVPPCLLRFEHAGVASMPYGMSNNGSQVLHH